MSTTEGIPPQALLDAKQFAEWLHVSVFKAREILRRGEVPSVRIGRLRRVKPEDVAAFIEAKRTTNGENP